MSTLLITKQTGNFFTLQLDSEPEISSEQNRLTTVGDICHFKTVSGANIIKNQNISYVDVTLVASGTFTFTSIQELRLKLEEVGFFDGVSSGGGGGGGVDNFTELLDTFNSYIGRDGQALVVNESELKIETVPFANVSAFTDLSDAPSPLLPNKMIVTNALGTALIMTDLPTTPETYLNAVGSFDYSDLATQTVPIAITAGVEEKLTNDTLGDYTKTEFAPFGVSTTYNPITNSFDFSQLSLGDWIFIRTDFILDLVGTNTSYKFVLKCAVGSGNEWELQIHNGERKSTDEFPESHEFSLVMNYQYTIDYPAELWITTDAGASLKVNGYQTKVTRRNINIVEIEAASDPLKEDVANKQNDLTPDGTGTKYPTVDAVNDALPSEYSLVVYVNDTDPADATIFDIENPPVTNDDDLKEDTANLYIGDDSSTWVWNGSIYTTKVVPESSNSYLNGTLVDAGNNKTQPINRPAPISVMEVGNKGISIWKHTLSFWKYITGVSKTVNVFVDNITNNYSVQFPNKAEAAEETFAMVSDLDDKQDTLVSGTNIKTVNGNSLLGSGDVVISGGGAVDSVNGQIGVVVLDTGDITEVTDKKYVTDAEKVVIGNTSGTNTGDQDLSSYLTSSTAAITYTLKPIQVTAQTLTAGSWTLVSGTYEYDLSNANITTTSIVDVIPDNSYISTVQVAEVYPKTLSGSGTVKLYAKNLPTGNIIVTINIWK